MDEAKNFLYNTLANGPIPVKKSRNAHIDASLRKAQRRVCRRLGMVAAIANDFAARELISRLDTGAIDDLNLCESISDKHLC